MADMISAIASLLWPLLVIVVLLVFGRQLLSKLRSSDDVTLEIGGQRINFKQATDQQSDMITDLQREVASLKRRMDDSGSGASYRLLPGARPPYEYSQRTDENDWFPPIETPDEAAVPEEPEHEEAEPREATPSPEPGSWGVPRPAPGGPASPGGPAAPSVPPAPSVPASPAPGAAAPAHPSQGHPRPRSILWVDDHPENNAVLAESWRRDGAEVETARTTGEALRLMGTRKYGLIISDMGRRESNVDVPDAGLQLLAKVRAADPGVPFVLYGNVGTFGEAARAVGAALVTDSTFDLVEFASGLGMFDKV
ncbi:hypothetical protein AB1046_16140 [Promicromonospora sp. Populi]|uniref:hypothetical protein n=1 Tax=Promicromonospora sp. Populi TaxID=3239420 RepID=UPI0034E2C9FE